MNHYLPEDIEVREAVPVPERFHSRLNAVGKTYAYRLTVDGGKHVFERRFLYLYGKPLDIRAMRRAAEYLTGTHDFKSFCSSHTAVEDTVRTVYRCSVEKEGDIITIRVTGSGFLYNMVRIIAGTLLQVGIGEIAPEQMPAILEAKNRAAAGPTAPAHGLTMIGIEYLKEPQIYEKSD